MLPLLRATGSPRQRLPDEKNLPVLHVQGDRTPTRTLPGIRQTGKDSSPVCVLCRENQNERLKHLFYECPRIQLILGHTIPNCGHP